MPAVHFAVASAPARGGPGEDVARTVQELALLEVPELRRRPAGRGMGIERRHHLPEVVGLQFHVVVEQRQQLTTAGVRADVERSGHADVLGQ